MKTEDKIQLIKDLDVETILRDKAEDGTAYLKIVFDLYQELFQAPCTGCPSQIPQYIKAIKKYNMENKQEIQDPRTFRLKKGKMIVIAGTSNAYSDYNITDDVALKLIAENPNRKALFVKLPDNLDALLAKHQKEQQKVKEEVNQNLGAHTHQSHLIPLPEQVNQDQNLGAHTHELPLGNKPLGNNKKSNKK